MIYRKFIIKNYKAIGEIEININREIVPLIGINESGKTSILHAILAFDKEKDNLMKGKHIDVANIYEIYEHKQEECIIAAKVIFKDEGEYKSIGETLKLGVDTNLYKWLEKKYNNKESIFLRRDYKDGKLQKNYSLYEETELIEDEALIRRFINLIVKHLPNILYYDDFSDRVPEKITFPDNYINERKFSTGKQREWQEILKEVFSRAIDEELSLITFMCLDDMDKRADYLSDVNDKLNKEITKEWESLKQQYDGFEEEITNIQLVLEYDKHEKVFRFKIKDRETEQSRTFKILDRSKGFQWFFNFIMKLRYNSKYKDHPDDAIYLLDEPGSYLHSTAQTGLLKKLKDISKKNTIIFCTHSQYLLEPSEINVGSVKIVSKKTGAITLTDFGSSKIEKNLGAYAPILHALKLKYGFNNHFKKSLLTEGIYDYYFFKMFFDLRSIEIIPGQGCGQLKDLISILISFCEKFLVVLDNDRDGNKAKDYYIEYFKESFERNHYIYDLIEGKFVLEDILSAQDSEKIKIITKCKNVKSALPVLFFGNKDNISTIKKEFDSETKKNIKHINDIVKKHFNT